MKRKKRQIQKNAAAQPGPAVEPESVPASGKKSVSEKAAAARLTFQKRKKQYQRMMTLLRVVIRIVNAAGRSTMYRK